MTTALTAMGRTGAVYPRGPGGMPDAVFEQVPAPAEMYRLMPASERVAATVQAGRQAVRDILDRKDDRLLVVVGPCSIHDTEAGLDYAQRLVALADELSDTLYVVMRAYFEKPRTTVGWKGLVNDPHMDDSCRIGEGMARARQFLLAVNALGLPVATEALDPLSPHYLGDLISWTAIGARTTESQVHRELSSGLATPVGFKNGTDGSVETAVNAILSAACPHAFMGMDQEGRPAIVRTQGNRYCHLVMRGGGGRPNYDTVSIHLAEKALEKHHIPTNIIVDCAHANSWKQHALQPGVLADVVNQIREGNQSIRGVMIESFIEAGNQPIPADLGDLRYGCSVTDACVSWPTTEKILRQAGQRLAGRRGWQA